MTIYLDIVFFENLFMNFCILYCASMLNNKKRSIYRLIVASMLGALYYVAILLPQAYFLTYAVFKIILLLLIVVIAFKYIDIHSYIQDLLCFSLMSFVFGGVMYGLYYFIFNKLTIPYYPMRLIIFGTISLVICVKVCIGRIKCNLEYRKIMYSVQIDLNGKVKKLKGFLDTGNCLKDPITNTPILLVNYTAIKELLPQDICKVCENNLNNLSDISKENERRVRVLPYTSVGNQNGLMLGYKMDKVTIYLTKDENIVLDNALVGINTTKLNNENAFDVLLSIELLELQRGKRVWEECSLKS